MEMHFSHNNYLPNFNTDKVDSLLTLDNDYFQLSEYHPQSSEFPKYFHIDYYAVEILLEGEMHCNINLHDLHAKAPCVITLLPDFVLHVESASKNCKVLILAHDDKFADDLQMQDYSYRAKQAARAYPCNKLTKHQLQVSVQYFHLLREVLRQQNNPNVRDCVIKLTSSWFHYLQGIFSALYKRQAENSRAEQLTADFFALAEKNSCQHKNIAWYAEQLCIAPKYLANVIKKTTGKTVGSWLGDYVVLQAKTLLTTSCLSVQQIADNLGFQNQSHFGTYFRRATGVSPRKYREMRGTGIRG